MFVDSDIFNCVYVCAGSESSFSCEGEREGAGTAGEGVPTLPAVLAEGGEAGGVSLARDGQSLLHTIMHARLRTFMQFITFNSIVYSRTSVIRTHWDQGVFG